MADRPAYRPSIIAIACIAAAVLTPANSVAGLPSIAVRAGPALLSDVGRTLIPSLIVLDGLPAVRVVEARYCGIGGDDGSGKFLIAVQHTGSSRPAGREVLLADCHLDLTKVAERLAASGSIDGVMFINASWKPWAIELRGVDFRKVGTHLSANQEKLLSGYFHSEDVSNLPLKIDSSSYQAFLAIHFSPDSIIGCIFFGKDATPSCDSQSLPTEHDTKGANSTFIISNQTVTDALRQSGGLELHPAPGINARILSYTYVSSEQEPQLDLKVSDESSGRWVGATVKLSSADLSVSDADVDSRITANCGANPASDCRLTMIALGGALRHVLLSERRPLEAKVEKQIELQFLNKTSKFVFDSKRIWVTPDYLVADLSTVVNGVK